MIHLSPSLLAADFGQLAQQVAEVERAGANSLHVDIMDGRFVPNLSFGPMVPAAVRPHAQFPFHVHLMVLDAAAYVPELARCCQLAIVHPEADPNVHRTLGVIRSHGLRAGLALNPGTPLAYAQWLAEEIDYLLIMTVNPGFGGQAFIPAMLAKVREARDWINGTGRRIDLAVDGGIDAHTGRQAVTAGATLLVAGSSVFHHPNGVAAGLSALRSHP